MKLLEPNRRRTNINLTSLIDILFLLIIFFAVSTQFLDQRGFRLELPKSKNADKVSATRKLVILFPVEDQLLINGEVYTWKELENELNKKEYDREENVILNVDQSISHGSVIRLMDLLKSHEFKKVAFGTRHTS